MRDYSSEIRVCQFLTLACGAYHGIREICLTSQYESKIRKKGSHVAWRVFTISTVLCVCKKRMGKPTSYSYSKLSVRDSRWESLWKIRSVVWWFEILVLKFLLQDDNVLTNYVIHIGRDRFIAIRSGNMFLMIVNVFLETDSCLRYLHERLRTILEYCSWYPIDLKIIIVLYSRVSRKTIQCNQILILGRWCWSYCQLFIDLLVRLGVSVVRTEENSVITLRILFRIDRTFINILMTEARVCHYHIHVTDDLGTQIPVSALMISNRFDLQSFFCFILK